MLSRIFWHCNRPLVVLPFLVLVLMLLGGLWFAFPVWPRLSFNAPDNISQAVTSHNGKVLALLCDRTLVIHDCETGAQLARHAVGDISLVRFSNDGTRITYWEGRDVKSLDWLSGKEPPQPGTAEKAPRPSEVTGELMQIPHADQIFYLEKQSDQLVLWESAARSKILLALPWQDDMPVAALSPDEKLLGIYGRDEATVWDLGTGTRRARIKAEGDPGLLIVSANWLVVSHAGAIEFWNIISDPPQLGRTIKAGSLAVWDAPQGCLWVRDQENTKIFDCIRSDQPVIQLERTADYNAPGLAPDGKTFATIHDQSSTQQWLDSLLGKPQGQSIQLWRWTTGEKMTAIPGKRGVFSKDGKFLMVLENDQVAIWDIPPRRPLVVMYGLPTAAALLLVFGCWYCWRQRKLKRVGPNQTFSQ